MDNLFNQIVNISKAGAYDIVSKQCQELQDQKNVLRYSLRKILSEISSMDIADIANNPSLLIGKISVICSETLAEVRP